MTTIRVTGQIDTAHRLTASVPAGIPAGPVEVVLVLPAPEADAVDAAWLQGVAREWPEDLGDVRQDVYTLSDGQPPHEAG